MENKTALVDEHLQSLEGMKEAATDDFFYTRLRARMEHASANRGWGFSLRPAWILSALLLMLLINGFMLAQLPARQKKTTTAGGISEFASSYDQTISSY